MEASATYTPEVKRIADAVRKLTVAEMVALRDALAQDFRILPPDIGVREPAPEPRPSLGGAA
jgi:hypothetical protein